MDNAAGWAVLFVALCAFLVGIFAHIRIGHIDPEPVPLTNPTVTFELNEDGTWSWNCEGLDEEAFACIDAQLPFERGASDGPG